MMHYSLSLPTLSFPVGSVAGGFYWPVVSIGVSALDPGAAPPAERDPRWRALVARLKALRKRGRRSVRIVDVRCGGGVLLIQAAQKARSLGFLAIECLGVDRDPDDIEAARQRALRVADTAIGLRFDLGDPLAQLADEAEFPPDIVLYEASAHPSHTLREAVKRAGDLALRVAPTPRRACA